MVGCSTHGLTYGSVFESEKSVNLVDRAGLEGWWVGSDQKMVGVDSMGFKPWWHGSGQVRSLMGRIGSGQQKRINEQL